MQKGTRLDEAPAAHLHGICSAPLNWEAPPVFFAEMAGGLDLLTPAAGVRAPALLVSGAYDVVVPATITSRLAATMPGAEYLEIPGAGHFVEVEARARFSDAVVAFLSDAPDGF